MEITEEYIRDVVARRPKEVEYYVGLQRFRNAKDAFMVMDDDWGERNPCGCAHLVVERLDKIVSEMTDRPDNKKDFKQKVFETLYAT